MLITRGTTITPEVLFALGFFEHGVDYVGLPAYHLNVPKLKTVQWYPYQFRITIRPSYGVENPNVGVVYVGLQSESVGGVPADLFTKSELTKEDYKRISEHKLHTIANFQQIAWYVHEVGRLHDLIKAISGYELLEDQKVESDLAANTYFPSDPLLPTGVYTILWVEGGESLAAVNRDRNGDVRFAPTNWTSSERSLLSDSYDDISEMILIKK